MDQAQLLSIIGDLYDKLVADVAARVANQAAAEWADKLADAASTSQSFYSAVDARVENWMDSYLDERIGNWADDNLDLEDAAKEAIQNSDHLADFIADTVRNSLTFTVSVD